MIQIVVGIVLILLHIICCILVWVGICTHIINYFLQGHNAK